MLLRSRSSALKIAYLARLMRLRFDRSASALGLTRAQWQAIAAIALREGATQSEIAAALDVSSVTIGRLIDKLEKNGWIERRADEADRRAHRLFLRPQARPILDKLEGLGAREEEQMLASFDDAERAMLDRVLDRAIANMEAPGKPDLA